MAANPFDQFDAPDPNAGRGVYGSGGFEDRGATSSQPAQVGGKLPNLNDVPEGATDISYDPNTGEVIGYTDPKTGHPVVNIYGPAKGNAFDQFDNAPDNRPTSFAEGVLQGAEKPLNHAAEWLEAGLNKVGLAQPINALGARFGLAPSVAEAERQQAMRNAAAPSRPSAAGQFVGEVGALAPLAAVPGGILTQGALGGALTSDDQSAGGLAQGALLGAAGGKLGELGLRAAGQVVAPIVNDGLRTLINAGVRVTPGQAARAADTGFGDFLARTEDRAVSTPFVGDAIVQARNSALGDFARATVGRAVEPIGLSVPDNISGRRAIQWAGDRLSDAYDQILPNLRATGDQQFVQDLAQIHADAQTLAPGRVQQFNNILNDLGRYWQGGSQLDGAALKNIETRLGQRIRRMSSSPDADQQDLGAALEQVRSAVRDLAARQNPQYAQDLQAVNRGWASLTQVEKAGLNSHGDITPAGYSQAVRQGSATVRRRGYARGEALNQDLSDAASDILPSAIADSGTAGRWQQSNIPALLMGAAQAPAFAAARAVTPLVTRSRYTAPAIADLLRLGSRFAPALVTPGTSSLIAAPTQP